MKRAFRLLALVLALALLSGCGLFKRENAEETPVDESASAPIELATHSTEELFFLPVNSDLGANPFTCTSMVNSTFLPLMYESLFNISPEFTAQPCLCSSWTVSDDQRSYAFTIQDCVVFHSGNLLMPEDVAYSLNYARDTDAYGQRLSCIRSVEVVNSTVIVQLDQARDQFPLLLDVPIVRTGTADQPIPDGTGPYLLAREAAGDYYLDAFKNWRLSPAQPISRIYLLECTTVTDVRDSFEYGRVGLACTDVNGVAGVAYHSDCEQWSMHTTVLTYLGFNRLAGPFTVKALRQAVTYAIDRDTIVTGSYGGYASPAPLPASPASPIYNSALAAGFSRSPAKARQVIEDAGLKDQDGDGILDYETEDGYVNASGALIVCEDNRAAVSAAQYVLDDLNALGLDLTLEVLTAEAYADRKDNGTYALCYEEMRLTADFNLRPLLRHLGVLDSYMSMLCDLALENLGNFYDLHETVVEDGVFCPVVVKNYAVYAARGWLSGLDPAPYNVFYQTQNIRVAQGEDA